MTPLRPSYSIPFRVPTKTETKVVMTCISSVLPDEGPAPYRFVVIARNSRRRSLEILYVLLFLYVDVVVAFRYR